jgi:hypothetical protein
MSRALLLARCPPRMPRNSPPLFQALLRRNHTTLPPSTHPHLIPLHLPRLLHPRLAPSTASTHPTFPQTGTGTGNPHPIFLAAPSRTPPPLNKFSKLSDAEERYEARPYTNYPEERRAIYVHKRRRTQRTWKARSEAVGESKEGRDGIDPVRSCWKREIHGGLLVTLLDKRLARTVSG